MLITFYNEDENIPPDSEEIDQKVELNVIRVQGAEALQQTMKYAEMQKYKEGQQLIDNFLG